MHRAHRRALRSVQCANEDSSLTSGYMRLRSLTFGLIVLYPIGIPLAVAVLLYVCRRWPLMAQRMGLANEVRSLHVEYNAYYWEPVELVRRSFLTVP